MLPGGRGEEFVIIAALALIVIGPKDLPKVLREIGRFVGKMRRMADEFKTSFDDMARQSELDDLRKEVDALRASKLNAPIIDDIKHEMRALDSEVKGRMAPVPGNTTVDIPGDAILPDVPTNPQLDGLPPTAELPQVVPAAPQPVPDVVVKKARKVSTKTKVTL